jgi:hypothetical protein
MVNVVVKETGYHRGWILSTTVDALDKRSGLLTA